MRDTETIAARAYTSIANLGWGLDAFGVCVDAASDVVEVRIGGSGLEIELTGSAVAGIPTEPERNTAGRAAAALMRAHDIRRPVRMRIRKGTRPGSGLGSSAASAAAAVVATDALFGLNLPREVLVGFAAEGERAAAGAAHADNVAASICGGFTIVSDGVPPRLVTLEPPASLCFVVVTPDVEVRTSRARAALPETVAIADYARGGARCGAIVAAIMGGDAAALGRAIEGSFVDACRAPFIPGYDRVCAAAREAGATGVVISGAGPTLAAVVGSETDCDAVVRAMTEAFAAAGTASDARVARVAGGARIVEERA